MVLYKCKYLYKLFISYSSLFSSNLLTCSKSSIFNIGTGTDNTIREYVDFILKKLNVKIKIIWDQSKPDGVKRKLLDISLAKKYGWQPSFTLDQGFKLFYKDFLKENV